MTEVIATPTELDASNQSDGVQAKLVIREGHLRVEQVSAAEIKSTDSPGEDIKLDTSNISVASVCGLLSSP